MNDQIIDTYLDEIDRMSDTSDNQPPVPSYEQLEAEYEYHAYHAMLHEYTGRFYIRRAVWHVMQHYGDTI